MPITNLRTIRRFQEMAKSSDLTDVTLYNFRSLEEVKEYVNQLMKSADQDIKDINDFKRIFASEAERSLKVQAIKAAVTKIRTIKTEPDAKPAKVKLKEGEKVPVEFIAPPAKDLEKKFEALTRLQTKIESLDTIIYKVASEHHDDPKMTGEISRYLKTRREKLQKAQKEAYAFLENVAKKTEPKQFRLLVRHLVNKVVTTYEDSFDSYKEFVYLSPRKTSDEGKTQVLFVYNHYLELTNFVNDLDQVSPKFYIVFTGEVNPTSNQMAFYFSTLKHYAAPGSFVPEHPFTKEAKGWEALQISLEAENYSTFIERVPLDLTKRELEKTKWSVPKGLIRGMGVEQNVITFSLSPQVRDKTQALNIADVLNRELIEKVVPVTKGHVARRVYKQKGTNVWVVDFVVLNPSRQHLKDIRLNQEQVDTFSIQFGWTPQRAAEFVRTFNKFKLDLEDDDAEAPAAKPAAKPMQTLTIKSKGTLVKIMEMIEDLLNTAKIPNNVEHHTGIPQIVVKGPVEPLNKKLILDTLQPMMKGTGLSVDRVRAEPEEVVLFFREHRGKGQTPGTYTIRIEENKIVRSV